MHDGAAIVRPLITSPVAVYISVSDVDRSVAFYRDVLGFEEHAIVRDYGLPAAAEVVYGPARVQFGTGGAETTTVAFFETDNVDAMHAAISQRGGGPSKVQKVNWIKMAMFEIHDSDGHTLWFGQSLEMPDSPVKPSPPVPFFRQIMPELHLKDVPAGVTHYRDVLGFEVNYQQHDFAVMDRDKARILLLAKDPPYGRGSAYIYIEKIDLLYSELKTKGANIQSEPISRPWGVRELVVFDLEENRITLAETFE